MGGKGEGKKDRSAKVKGKVPQHFVLLLFNLQVSMLLRGLRSHSDSEKCGGK